MASVNKVILVGRVGQDPETRYLPNGDAVTNLSVATSDSWKDKNSGEKKETTEWHKIVFYRKLAEIAGQYLKKGSQVYIEGKIKTRKWQDKDGQDRYTTEIAADELVMLGGRDSATPGGRDSASTPAQNRQPPDTRPRQAPPPSNGPIQDMNDDIPF